MQDKRVLGQFHAKIAKAKVLHDSTAAINAKLQKQYLKLTRENNQALEREKSMIEYEQQKKQQLYNIKNGLQRETQIHKHMTKQVADGRKTKKQLERQKLICDSQIQKLTLQCQQLMKTKSQLEETAQSLNQKLNLATSQKNILEQQYKKTQILIHKCAITIGQLQKQINQMRDLISTNTVPVYRVQSEKSESQTWEARFMVQNAIVDIVERK